MIDWEIRRFETLDSTQSALKSLTSEHPDLSEGLLVVANQQSFGYGRHGRQWLGGYGNLYFSFLLRPQLPIQRIGQLSIICGLALYDLAAEAGIEKQSLCLKWPNDLLISNKKASGILIETQSLAPNGIVEAIVVGIGVNIGFSPDPQFTCFQDHSEISQDPNRTLNNFLKNFDLYYKRLLDNDFDVLRGLWLERSFPIGQNVNVKFGKEIISGEFVTIDEYANLALRCPDGSVKTLHSGEIFDLPA